MIRVVLGMPGYNHVTANAARAYWRATRMGDDEVCRPFAGSSLLASNFNTLWTVALNIAHESGLPYFAMQHADIEPEDWWLDTLIEEIEAKDLDVLGVSVPIKDGKGLTSLALERPDGDTWRPLCRLTTTEVANLPDTFTADDIGHPLLLNTGLWVCRFKEEWARKVYFTINDRIVIRPDGFYTPQVEPEDWFFSRLCNELSLKIGATRKIALDHRGEAAFSNQHKWGEPFDKEYLATSVLEDGLEGFIFPTDIEGWLYPEEGRELARLARGKRVLEIGSYCGGSTVCLAQTAESVVAVDPFDGRGTPCPQNTHWQFDRNIDRYAVSHKVEIRVGTTEAILPYLRLEGPFDLVFIDGAHDVASVASDAMAALELLAPDGLIVFHDYVSPDDPGVAVVVDELVERGAQILSVVRSLAVVRPSAAPSQPQLQESSNGNGSLPPR